MTQQMLYEFILLNGTRNECAWRSVRDSVRVMLNKICFKQRNYPDFVEKKVDKLTLAALKQRIKDEDRSTVDKEYY